MQEADVVIGEETGSEECGVTAVDENEEAVDMEEGSEAGAEEREGEGRRMSPVSESIRYRRRAQAAERKLEIARRDLRSVESDLEAARAAISAIERRQQIDSLLVESDVLDLEAARLLTEAAVLSMEEEDVEEAVKDLREKRPYLFRETVREGRKVNGGMGVRSRKGGSQGLRHAAEQASVSGDRGDLLRYLRMRRIGTS